MASRFLGPTRAHKQVSLTSSPPPDGLVVTHLPYGPTAYFSLSNVVARHDIPKAERMSEAYPHLIFEGFSTALGERATSILKYLFPVPKDDSRRVMTFANDADFISFRWVVLASRRSALPVPLLVVVVATRALCSWTHCLYPILSLAPQASHVQEEGQGD